MAERGELDKEAKDLTVEKNEYQEGTPLENKDKVLEYKAIITKK